MTPSPARSETYGPRLVAWFDELRGAQSVRSWAGERGLDDARISAWRKGGTPGLDQLRDVADALNVHLGDVLLAAGFVEPGELVISAPREAPPPSVDDAIDRDPTLADGERELLRAARKVARDALSGNVKSGRARVELRRPKPPRRK